MQVRRKWRIGAQLPLERGADPIGRSRLSDARGDLFGWRRARATQVECAWRGWPVVLRGVVLAAGVLVRVFVDWSERFFVVFS
jgi:hypothetical protein